MSSACRIGGAGCSDGTYEPIIINLIWFKVRVKSGFGFTPDWFSVNQLLESSANAKCKQTQ